MLNFLKNNTVLPKNATKATKTTLSQSEINFPTIPLSIPPELHFVSLIYYNLLDKETT